MMPLSGSRNSKSTIKGGGRRVTFFLNRYELMESMGLKYFRDDAGFKIIFKQLELERIKWQHTACPHKNGFECLGFKQLSPHSV